MLSPERKKELDAAIVSHIAASEVFQNASMLLLYAPMPEEINLLPLARLARKAGKPIAFPKCDKETNTMRFYILKEDARLTPGAYNIPEPPADAPLCVPDSRALCLLPGLSFDLSGARLGYGKGYYDRYLATFPGVTLGAVYGNMILRRVPTDKHDIPTAHLVCERGFLTLNQEKKVQKRTNAPQKTPHSGRSLSSGLSSFWKEFREDLRVSWKGRRDTGLRPLHLPPVLVLVTFALLLLSRILENYLFTRDSEYIGVILLQILIFVLPSILYCRLRGEKFTARIRLAPPKLSHLFLLLWMLFLMVSGSLLLSILTGGIASLEGNFTLYGTFVAHTGSTLDILYSILSYALLPAFGEEMIYRSILSAEYERRGVGVAITVTSLFFAMLHFSLPLFFSYLFLGAMLSFAMYATRSVWAPVILHLCYNLFCLFGQPYLSAFYLRAGSTEIFVFCLTVLFLLSAALTAGEGRKIYHLYALSDLDASYTQKQPPRSFFKRLVFSLLSPTVLACAVVWLTVAILNLF